MAFMFAVVLRIWFLSCCCPVAKSFPAGQTTIPLIASVLLKRGEQRMGWERKICRAWSQFWIWILVCLIASLYPTLCELVDCRTSGFPVLHHLPELAQIHAQWVSDAIQSFHPLSSPSPPALNLSQHQGLFQWVGSSYLSKYRSFSFSIRPFNEYSGLVSFRIDWFDLSEVQETLKSFLQHHSSKASILRCSAIFMVQLAHLYMTTGKTTALSVQTLVVSVMSLLFNMLFRSFVVSVMSLLFYMLFRSVIAFLSRSKCLLISWLQSPSTVILEPKKWNLSQLPLSPIYLPWSDGLDAMIFIFLNVEFQTCFCTLLFHPHQEVLLFLFTFCH